MSIEKEAQVLYLASKNSNKLREFKEILGVNWLVKGVDDLDPQLTWVESGQTFADNAKIKVLALKSLVQTEPILGEDSGLCIDALDGAPGVFSARYYGDQVPQEQKNKKILEEMQGLPLEKRTAYFVCCIQYLNEKQEWSHFEGRCYGTIAEQARGGGGFGYDPIFIPKGSKKTLSQMTSDEKHELSHRRKAISAWRSSILN